MTFDPEHAEANRNGEVVAVCTLFQEMHPRRSQSIAEVSARGPKGFSRKLYELFRLIEVGKFETPSVENYQPGQVFIDRAVVCAIFGML